MSSPALRVITATRLAPVIEDVLNALASAPGARLARMSGSGATCFALFDDRAAAVHASRALALAHPGWWVRADVAALRRVFAVPKPLRAQVRGPIRRRDRRRPSPDMRLVSTPDNPVPPLPDPVRAAHRRRRAAARGELGPAKRGARHGGDLRRPRRVHREILRDRRAICWRAACRSRSSTGAGKAARSGSCAIRARATSTTSRSTSAISSPLSPRCSNCPARDPGSASAIRWARRSCWRSRGRGAARWSGWCSARR